MNQKKRNRTDRRNLSLRSIVLVLAACLVIADSIQVVVYRPDRAISVIVPGSSSGPAFAVQIIRPRAGPPLGGLLTPELFGLNANLRFDSTSPGAGFRVVDPARIALRAEGWSLILSSDGISQVAE